MGSTRMFVCMNRCAGPKARVIGAVVAAIGSRAFFMSSSATDGGIGPAPEDPVSVRCGGLYFASFGSYRSLIARTCSATSSGNSAKMNIPFSNHRSGARGGRQQRLELYCKQNRVHLDLRLPLPLDQLP